MGGLIRQTKGFPLGYTPIAEIGGSHAEMGMDFGILRLRAGESHDLGGVHERALLLLSGQARVVWDGGSQEIFRVSLFDELPWCLHLPSECGCTVNAGGMETEFALQAADNPNLFPPRLYAPADCRVERRGEGTMGETSTRIVWTIFDESNAPQA